LRDPDLHETPAVLVQQRLTLGAQRVFEACRLNVQGVLVLLKVVHSYHEVYTLLLTANVWEELWEASIFMRE
jgi:hypothetical protein